MSIAPDTFKVAKSGKRWVVRTLDTDTDATDEYPTREEAEMECVWMNEEERRSKS
jgi:ferredoxin